MLGVLTRWGKLLGIAPGQVEDLNSCEAWGRTLRATIGTWQMLLVMNDARRTEDALTLRVGGTACVHLLTTHLPEIALAFAQQGAIVVSQLEDADRIALLQRVTPKLVEQRDSKRALLQVATLS